MKKFILIFILLPFLIFPQSLKYKINKVLNDKFFDTCLVSIQVEDLITNKTLFKKNEKILLRPASNMKILTSSAGLMYLGPDYEFKTDLYTDGYVLNDTLFGNLYFVGGCDPDFTTKDFYYFVDELKSKSVSVIIGNLYGDVTFKDSLYWGKGWMWDDDPSSDAPYLSALNLNDNCVEVFFDGARDSIIISPKTKFVNSKRIKDDEKLIIDRNWFYRKNEIIVEGQNDGFNHYAIVNVLNPALYFLTVFKEVLDSNLIQLAGDLNLKKNPTNSNLIYSFKRKYIDVIPNLNKTSDNLSAEMTLYAIAEKYYGKPATADSGIQIVDMMIDSLGLNQNDYRIVDGSGVSHYNVVSAELISKLLKYLYDRKPELFKILYDSFPIAGVDGDLNNRMINTEAQNNVHAKTGTLTGVCSLSGYVQNKNGHFLTFSIIMQNYVRKSKIPRDFQDEICKILAESK